MKRLLIILSIFILAFSARLVFMVTTTGGMEGDQLEYDRLAMGLVETKGYVNPDGNFTSYRPPLYPAFLALIYMVFGHSHFIARIIQAIIASLTVCIFYLTAEKIFNRLTAILVGIFSSFYMTFVICTKLLYTETLFTFLLASIIYLVITTKRPNIIRFCILGFLCGFLTLVRGSALLMPFMAILLVTIKMHKENTLSSKKMIVAGIMLLLCFVSVILPWTVRNYKVHNRFILISTNAGINIYQAVKPVSGKIIGLGPRGDELSRKAFSISSETERNDFFIKAALEAYKGDPIRALKMFILRFLFFWNFIDWEIMGGETFNYHFLFILPFAFLGTVFSLRNKKEILAPLLMITYFMSLVLIFQGTPRYRMPIDGYIIMLGCYGIYEFIKRQKRKFTPVFCAGAYFLFTYALYKHSLETKYFIKGLMEKIGLW